MFIIIILRVLGGPVTGTTLSAPQLEVMLKQLGRDALLSGAGGGPAGAAQRRLRAQGAVALLNDALAALTATMLCQPALVRVREGEK